MKGPVIKHYGYVKDGLLYLHNNKLYEDTVKSFEGRDVEVTVEDKFEEKSNSQLGYIFGALWPSCQNTEMFGGWTKREFKDWIESEFLSRDYIKILNGKNKYIWVTDSLANISKEKASELINELTSFMRDNDIKVPDPEKWSGEKFRKDDKTD